MDIWSWLPWLGGGSTVALIVLALFAPSVLTVASAWLTALSPILKGIADGLVAYAKALWEGILDMFDNAKSVIFVATVCAIAFVWGYTHGHKARPKVCSDVSVPLPAKKPTGGVKETLEDFDDWLRSLW